MLLFIFADLASFFYIGLNIPIGIFWEVLIGPEEVLDRCHVSKIKKMHFYKLKFFFLNMGHSIKIIFTEIINVYNVYYISIGDEEGQETIWPCGKLCKSNFPSHSIKYPEDTTDSYINIHVVNSDINSSEILMTHKTHFSYKNQCNTYHY